MHTYYIQGVVYIMIIDRTKFYTAYRPIFGRIGSMLLVNNINTMLSALEKYQYKLNQDRLLEQCAYVAATVHHETGATYGTFKEQRQVATDTPRRKEVRRLQDRYWNTGYYGRGPIQLTWKWEYAAMEKATGRPLVSHPDLLLTDLPLGYQVAIYTMTDKSINGHEMSMYINKDKVDYYNCRRVVNILDQASLIQGYAIKFQDIFSRSIQL